MTNYSQKEINQILLTKKLNDFYLVIMENRSVCLTDTEYEEIINSDIQYGENKEYLENFVKTIKNDEDLKILAPEMEKLLYSFARIRHLCILTMINEEFYDIANITFVDLKRNKVVHYDNLTAYYNETNARIRCFTKKEESALLEDTVLLDVDNLSIITKYEDTYLNQEESEDLTLKFINEVKENDYTLKRNKKQK